MGHLAAATAQADCRVVIRGADGSGKTTLLNRYIDTLDDDISFATINETCADETQFYEVFLRQLGFNDITGSMRELRSITREFLVHRCIAGDPVLLIIDNAQLASPSVFEQLRWISEAKVEGHRVFSVVLAGNSDLARVIDSPAMSAVKFRSHVEFNIRACTEEEAADYVRHRLKLAGNVDSVKFARDAHPLIYRYTGGNPSVINTLCDALLTEAHALDSRVISEGLVRAVADSSQLLPHVLPPNKNARRKTDPKFKQKVSIQKSGERIREREPQLNATATKSSAGPTLPGADAKQLLEQILVLSGQLGELRSDRKEALADVAAREEDVSELQQQVSAQLDQLGELKSDKKRVHEDIEARDKEVNELQQRVTALLDQLGKFRSEQKRVHEDIEAREKDVIELRQQFEAQVQENEKLTRIVASNANEIDRLKKLVSDSKTAMADSMKTLKKSERAAKRASKKAVSDLKLANKRATEADALEVSNAALAEEMIEKTSQVSSLDKSLREFKKRLLKSESECESLRASEAALRKLEKSISEKDRRIDALQAELAAHINDNSSTQTLPDEQLNALSSSSAKQEFTPREFGAAIVAFEVVKDGKVERTLKVEDCQARIMVGRGEDSDLCLDSHFVSRHHALIFRSGEDIHIEDLNSFNGTIVNFKTVVRCELRPNDNVIIGDYQIRPR
jgi:type II secretory pathway predicted ATPase ExeA